MSIPVFSVVAWSGTGKTTFLEQLLPALQNRGLRTAVIKHDRHDFQVDKPGKDSFRMTQAGAAVSAVTNDAHAAIMVNHPLSIEEIVEKIQDVDVILTEGYKEGPWQKIGLVRSGTGKGLPPVEGVYLFVMADGPVDTAAPVLDLTDIEEAADRIAGAVAAGR